MRNDPGICQYADMDGAIEIIKGCDRSAEEKLHLRRLVGDGAILPARFAGTPNFADILEEFPVGKDNISSHKDIHYSDYPFYSIA
jgi:hypothetical protein